MTALLGVPSAGGSVAEAQLGGMAAPSTVVTTIDPCVPLDLAHFRRLLSIELGTSIDYQPEAPREPGQTWVHLTCAGGGVSLQLQDGVTHKSMMRVLDMSGVPPAEQTRLLALAVAEFVVASWVELKAVPQPALRAVGAPAEPPAEAQKLAEATVERKLAEHAPPPEPRATWELAIGFGLDTFTSHPAVLPTFTLRFGQSAAPLSFLIGGDVGFVRVPVVREDDAVAGSIDVLRASGLAALLFGGALGDVSLWAGVGVRFGVVRMMSESEVGGLSGGELIDPLGGPVVVGRVGHRFFDHFAVGLELEVGAVTLPVEATVDEQVLVGLSGAWFTAGLRAALLF